MHRIEDDIIIWKHRGKVMASDMLPILEDLEILSRRYPYQFVLIDASEISGYDAEARRHNAAWLRAHRNILFVTVIHGASTPMRILVGLVDGALRLINGQEPSVFVDNQAAGFRAIVALRSKLAAKL